MVQQRRNNHYNSNRNRSYSRELENYPSESSSSLSGYHTGNRSRANTGDSSLSSSDQNHNQYSNSNSNSGSSNFVSTASTSSSSISSSSAGVGSGSSRLPNTSQLTGSRRTKPATHGAAARMAMEGGSVTTQIAKNGAAPSATATNGRRRSHRPRGCRGGRKNRKNKNNANNANAGNGTNPATGNSDGKGNLLKDIAGGTSSGSQLPLSPRENLRRIKGFSSNESSTDSGCDPIHSGHFWSKPEQPIQHFSSGSGPGNSVGSGNVEHRWNQPEHQLREMILEDRVANLYHDENEDSRHGSMMTTFPQGHQRNEASVQPGVTLQASATSAFTQKTIQKQIDRGQISSTSENTEGAAAAFVQQHSISSSQSLLPPSTLPGPAFLQQENQQRPHLNERPFEDDAFMFRPVSADGSLHVFPAQGTDTVGFEALHSVSPPLDSNSMNEGNQNVLPPVRYFEKGGANNSNCYRGEILPPLPKFKRDRVLFEGPNPYALNQPSSKHKTCYANKMAPNQSSLNDGTAPDQFVDQAPEPDVAKPHVSTNHDQSSMSNCSDTIQSQSSLESLSSSSSSSDEEYRNNRIHQQCNTLADGGSLFMISPRSFLMGGTTASAVGTSGGSTFSW